MAATLKDFLQYWQEEGHSISIQASENTDAINLMTIHKSKGLEFPVVFFL
jgi:ATP-dependent exoDNAse (exonuclease V) beta subunit